MILPIVLDTCTILNLLRIDEDDEFLYKKLMKLNINLCSTVLDEINRNITRKTFTTEQIDYINTHISSLYKYIKLLDENIMSNYVDNIRQFCDYKKENGELYSVVISLHICREQKCRLYFYTDDYPAKNTFEKYFDYQQIGKIGDTVDLLLFLYWTNSDFKNRKLKYYLSKLSQEFSTPLKTFCDIISRKKNDWLKKMPRDIKLREHLLYIEEGINNYDFGKITKGVNFFKENQKKYPAIDALLDSYSNINFDGHIVSKISNIRKQMETCAIYK